jgi:hypothetical protein
LINNPASAVKTGSGSFTSTGAGQQTIAHGLQFVPKFIVLIDTTTPNTSLKSFLLISGASELELGIAASNAQATVTAADATNFYVVNGLNTENYAWAAFG